MELTYGYAAFSLLSALLLFIALKIFNSFKQQIIKEGARQVPGPWNLPVIGSLHRVLGTKLPHRAFSDLSAVYGPILRLKLGEIPIVVVSSAEAAREIMKTHDIVFASRPITKSVEALTYGGNDIIFGPYGELWRQMRRLCTVELLSAKRVRSFRAVREEEVSHLIRSIAASSGAVVNISKKLAEISNSITARAVIGGRCDDQELFLSALADAVEIETGFNVVDLFPSLPCIARITGYEHRVEQCKRKLDLIAEKIVQEHVEKMVERSTTANDDESLMAEDLIDVLLRIQREDEISLSKDNIKAMVNMRCSLCPVPHTGGCSRSRPYTSPL